MMTKPTESQIPQILSKERSVYIIEDNEELQYLYTLIFENTGWNIVGRETNGDRALLDFLSLENKPLIVICDIDLPGISGIEVTKAIIKRIPGQIVMFTSSNNDQLDDHPDLLHLPRLNKPFFPSDLVKSLRKINDSLPPEH